MRTDASRLGLATLFTVSGTAHFVVPEPFANIVPPALGAPRRWVYASGLAELACAAGLLARRPATRRRAGYAAAALLVAVFPANVYMALEAVRTPRRPAFRAATIARLPLQAPLIRAALRVARAGPLAGRGGT